MRRALAGVVALALLGLAPAASPVAAAPAPALALAPAPVSDAPPPERWATKVFAKVPSPGFPAYVHRHTTGRVYAGTYVAGDRQRSRVFEWSGQGALLRSWVVPGQRLGADHGVQVANQTHDG